MEKEKIKKTTYQKLKVKILNDIRVIVMSPDSEQAINLKIMYKFNFTSEDMMFYGHSSTDTQSIMNLINLKNKI